MNLGIGMLLRVALLPTVFFLIFAVLRILNVALPVEAGLSETMTTIFFASGGAVCYLMAILASREAPRKYFGRWFAGACALALLAIDETFMVHENLSRALGIADMFVFLIYGFFLLLIVFAFRDARRRYWVLMTIFGVCAVISQGADYLYGEGWIRIFGRDIDYEQSVEALGALFLSLAFASEAAAHLTFEEDND